MTATATALLNVCRSQLGYREGPDNDTKYGDWYGLPNQPYCAMGLSWCADVAHATDVMLGRYASCIRWVAAWKRAFQWVTWDAPAKAGDVVFFDWSGRHGTPVHVGIVERVEHGALLTIEFNTVAGDLGRQSDRGGVWRRRRSTDHVVGYGRPRYARETAVRPVPRTKQRPPIPLVVDGVWGRRTTIKLQQWLGLPASGVLGVVTRRKLQARLGVKVDGIWGRVTHKALQRLVKVDDDGIWGPVTIKALQRYLNRNAA